MFSGIIETKAKVMSVEMEGRCKRVRIKMPRGWKIGLGDSISVDGICSTVASEGRNYFEVEYMPETLSKTTATDFQKGGIINLERSLMYGERVHGHFVAGHVDSTAEIVGIENAGRSRTFRISLPKKLSRFVAKRGSVAVNGVSLTVAHKERTTFTVALIPHTLKVTNLGDLKKGDAVNIECDMIARYGLAVLQRGARVRTHAKR